METTTDTKSTIKLLDSTNPHLWNTIFQYSHQHQLFIFASDEQEPACHTPKKLHQQRWSTTTITTTGMHHPLPCCAHTQCMVSMYVQTVLMNVSGCHCFLHRGIQLHPSVLYVLPLLSSVTQQQKKCNGILVGRFNTYCFTTNIRLWCWGPTYYNSRHYLWSSSQPQ